MTELLSLLQLVLMVVGFLILIRALLSWFPSLHENEIVQLVMQITDPVLEPIRRILPPMGGLDLSPMIALILIYSILQVIASLG